MSPNMIQAVAQTRIDDFVRAADRRRLAAAPRETQPTAGKPIRHKRRFRLAIA